MNTIAAKLAASMHDPLFSLSLPEADVLFSLAAAAFFIAALIFPVIVARERRALDIPATR